MKNIHFYAPGIRALVEFLNLFPTAGVNITGLVVSFEGLRGEPSVVLKALEYILQNQWSTKVYDQLVYVAH